ncbi:MAG TPA: hypothetical protein VIJ86_11850 [Acidimicrobiales bacterium]
MAEWRPGAWAGAAIGLFVVSTTLTGTWVAAIASSSHPIPWWPLVLFAVLGVVAIVGFLIAMFKPHLLPDHKLSLKEREEERSAREPHKASFVEGIFASMFDPEVRRQEAQTRALERNAEATEKHTEELRRQVAQSDDSSSQDSI